MLGGHTSWLSGAALLVWGGGRRREVSVMEAENTHFDLIPLFTGRTSPYYGGAVNCGIPKHSLKLTGNVFQRRFGARMKKKKKPNKKQKQLLLKGESCLFLLALL